MANIQIFDNPDFGTVRTLEEDNGVVLFCGADIARALGYSNPSKALNDHCKGVTKRYTPTKSGEQEMSFIPESDLYRLIFSSKLPNAEKFTDWVTSEVLPSIRKHGSYTAGQANFDPNLPPELAMIEGLLNSMKQVCMTQKQQGTAIAQVNQRMDVMCEAMTTSANGDWRTACTNAIRAVAFKRGGGKHYEEVWSEVYDELLDNGFDIRRRLENRRKNAIAAGMSKSFVNKINALDVIADSKDKKLTSAFISSVRRIAAVESVRMDKLDSVAARQKM